MEKYLGHHLLAIHEVLGSGHRGGAPVEVELKKLVVGSWQIRAAHYQVGHLRFRMVKLVWKQKGVETGRLT